jgi:nucleotide-binding universal stress UspA family protein
VGPREAEAGATRIFDRIVCGIDASAQSLEAVRQAARLLTPAGRLLALAVFDEAVASEAGWTATRAASNLKRELELRVESVRTAAPDAEVEMVKGRPVPSLLAAIAREEATLVAVGSHGIRRTPGIIIGSVATTLLREAPCSVLVARRADDLERFPRSVVVGADGSPQSVLALEAARALSRRLGAPLHIVVATGGKAVDIQQVRSRAPECEEVEGSPVRVLIARSKDSDLIVVGSRGLHGIRALGSVSERVAHEAHCSVLVGR